MFSRLLSVLVFFSALSHSADISCSSSYVGSLSSCDWSLPCSSQSYCFHGDFGVWGNVYRCNPGGYYDTREEFSYVCASWLDDGGLPGSGGGGSPSASSASVDALTYTVVAACLLFSFLIGFSAGGRS